MNLVNRNKLSFVLAVALTVAVGCTEQGTDDTHATFSAPLQNGDAVEKSMSGPAQYTADWARELFPSDADFYIYKDGDLVRGAVMFSNDEICQFHAVAIVDGKAQFHSDACSGAIEGAILDLSCRTRPNGNFACSGILLAPQGETGTGTMLADIVYAPEGPYEGPKEPYPDQENGNCPGSQSPCGATGCCAPFERCGDGQCWMPVDESELE